MQLTSFAPRFAAGVTGFGRAVTSIPWPVIEGFTLGIATIVFLQQVPAAVGSGAPSGQRPLLAAWQVLRTADWATARSVARRSSVTREELPGPRLPGDDRIALLRLDGAMFFGVAERISNMITDGDQPEVSVVIIRMSSLGMLDATGAHTLADIAAELESRGITVIIKGVQAEHLNLLTNVGVIDSLRHENHLIDSLDDAIAHARSHVADAAVP